MNQKNSNSKVAKVLVDGENAFAVSLKKLALKKSANNEVFSQIKIAFDRALSDPDFKRKKTNFTSRKKMVKS